MNHYSDMMTPLDTFRHQLAQEVQKNAFMKTHAIFPKIEQGMENGESFAMKRVIENVETQNMKKRMNMDQDIVSKENSKDTQQINYIVQELEKLKAKVLARDEQITNLNKKVSDMEKKLKYIPMSGHLR